MPHKTGNEVNSIAILCGIFHPMAILEHIVWDILRNDLDDMQWSIQLNFTGYFELIDFKLARSA